MQFENKSAGEALLVPVRQPDRREAAAVALLSPRARFLETPVHAFRAPAKPRHPIAIALSWGATQVVEGFALCGASLYPELAWQRHEPEGLPCPRRADGRRESQTASSREAFATVARRSWARDLVERRQAGRSTMNRPIRPDDRAPIEAPPLGGPGWGRRFASFVAGLWWRLLHEVEMRRMRYALLTLDDRSLKDIGISRHEIGHVVRNGRSWR